MSRQPLSVNESFLFKLEIGYIHTLIFFRVTFQVVDKIICGDVFQQTGRSNN
jgi:hypothetical protein